MTANQYKELPSVSEILIELPDDIYMHQNILNALINKELSRFRKQARSKELILKREQIKAQIVAAVIKSMEPSLTNVINGTGIVLHTGFGRAPLHGSLLKRVAHRLQGYVNLEYNLSNGKRGDRLSHLNGMISAICGSESSIVVNNNAAAVLLILNTLAEGKEVIVSRGQQVEIGGSFRIPDIIRKSQGVLKEVGTTNRTHLKDYHNAITGNTGLLLWVHTSNYVVRGFTSEISLSDLVELGKKKRIPVVADLGSGALFDLTKKNLPFEIPVQDIVRTGASLISFSGDKLLGGPQAGIIVGKKRLVNKVKSNPIYRAVRCDKMTIALLEETLHTYRTNDATAENLALTLLTATRSELLCTGEKIMSQILPAQKSDLGITLIESTVEAGSGSLPVEALESVALKFVPRERKVTELARQFRSCGYPVVGYISGNAFYIDLKAILPDQINILIDAINKI